MNFENPISTRQAFRHLHAEIKQLVHHIQARGAMRFKPPALAGKTPASSKSIANLAHYLALRELDLRPLQEQLSEAGLSSLSSIEPHVFASLKSVLHMLSRALGIATDINSDCLFPDFRESIETLEKNTTTVLGQSHHQRSTRIMVTMPVEAADDYAFVHNLIQEGMDIARINCAHDDTATWRRMIDNIRRAAAENQVACRIMMDLAGHKIRTGPVTDDAQALNIKIKKHARGKASSTIAFKIISDEKRDAVIAAGKPGKTFLFPAPNAVYTNLAAGDRFSIIDTRGKQRYITIAAQADNQPVTGYCDKTIHLVTGLQVIWQRRDKAGYSDQHAFKFVNLNPVMRKIRLFAGDNLSLHKQQIPGYVEQSVSDSGSNTHAHISCSSASMIDLLDLGARVWIDDGKISAYVSEKAADHVVLRISRTTPKGSKLKSGMGLNFPETTLNLPALTEKDQSDLDFICENADMVGFSFVETADGLHALANELLKRNASTLPIIAKIETARAVKNLPDILSAGLSRNPVGIMIARGDLAVELGNVRMAEIQEEILWLCEAAHVPVIWATQVLESIAKYGVRSRPEFTDAAMSARAECVMLNKGPYIVDAVRSLNAVLKCMQQHQHKKHAWLRAMHWQAGST
ncbi:MAG TPA: pyruvate kinase [Nitrosomonas sp.]|nr:pyruvate kinase [Nitrosomonas sp.]